MKLVTCNSCGTKNRVSFTFKRHPWCGSCRAALPEPIITKVTRYSYRGRYLGAVITVLTLLSIWRPLPAFDLSDLWTRFQTDAQQREADKDLCESYPQPRSGLYARYSQAADVAPLTIKTPPGLKYFVKLEDATTRTPVMTFFFEGGTTLRASVPQGSFVLKYATGKSWCGDRDLFGKSTTVSKTRQLFSFAEGEGYTLELILQTQGNLLTDRISRDAF